MRQVFSSVLFCIIPLCCFAQEKSSVTPSEGQSVQTIHARAKGRPKIGVALEGGGALGEAHIGVLKWFEDHHIPVDYIAGTSMGGLMGGLYATGKSADQMHEVVKMQIGRWCWVAKLHLMTFRSGARRMHGSFLTASQSD